MTIKFYAHGVILETPDTAYPVDPNAVMRAMIANLPAETFDTGLLHPDTLYVWQRGEKRVMVGYRAPQLTGVWLEGSDDPLRVPLPGLVMSRTTFQHKSPTYQLFAVLDRPQMHTPLYAAPLPNVSRSGTCWGTVAARRSAALRGADMSEDWTAFMGSRFSSHNVDGKSVQYPDDIRQALIALDGASAYPVEDLVAVKGGTFGQFIGGLTR